MNENANNHENIRKIIMIESRCYCGLLSLFKSKSLFKKINISTQNFGQTDSTIGMRDVGNH